MTKIVKVMPWTITLANVGISERGRCKTKVRNQLPIIIAKTKNAVKNITGIISLFILMQVFLYENLLLVETHTQHLILGILLGMVP